MKHGNTVTMLRLSLAALFIGMMLLQAGCAVPERKVPDIVWPPPPDEPKVKLVEMFSDINELGWRAGIAESIFGEEMEKRFVKPYGVAVDKDGRIYITDVGRVWVIDMKQQKVSFLGEEPGMGRVAFPMGVAASSDGRIFVTDLALNRVFIYRSGKFIAAIGAAKEFENASSVAVDDARKLVYVCDTRKHMVSVYSLDNYSRPRTIGSRGPGNGEFNFPTNLALDGQGRLYVVDTGNNRVQVFGPDGAYIKSIGKIGDTPGDMARPKGIGIDSEGHIYVVDAAFQNFQIFNYEGQLMLYVGSGGTEPGKFLLPAGLAIDKDDKIYVINQIPPSLQIFQYMSERWRRAHGG